MKPFHFLCVLSFLSWDAKLYGEDFQQQLSTGLSFTSTGIQLGQHQKLFKIPHSIHQNYICSPCSNFSKSFCMLVCLHCQSWSWFKLALRETIIQDMKQPYRVLTCATRELRRLKMAFDTLKEDRPGFERAKCYLKTGICFTHHCARNCCTNCHWPSSHSIGWNRKVIQKCLGGSRGTMGKNSILSLSYKSGGLWSPAGEKASPPAKNKE